MTSPLIILAAGGTGGHIFPAEALAEELMGRGFRLALITDKRGHAFKGTLGELETHRVLAGGIAGKSIPAKIKSGFELAIGTVQAFRLMRRLRPSAVVGFGGYAALPAMLAAALGGTPSAIHEQNALLGRANRLLAGRVRRIATSFAQTRGLPEGAGDKVRLTGMPVRPAIAAMRNAPYGELEDEQKINLLVLGGSQGATILSEVVPAALERLGGDIRDRLNVIQQCRAEDLAATQRIYQGANIKAELATFIDNVPECMAAAHLVIARAGASTVAEVMCVGRPSILVPYPFAADDHQTFNAQAVDGVGAGWIMPQDTFTPANLAARLDSLFGLPAVLKKAAIGAHEQGRPDAASHLADMVSALIHSEVHSKASGEAHQQGKTRSNP